MEDLSQVVDALETELKEANIEIEKLKVSATKWNEMEAEYWEKHEDLDFDLNLGEWIANKLEP